MNQNPLWKYLLLIAVCAIGFIYAMPNLYPSNPALQISLSNTNDSFAGNERESITKSLTDANIAIKKIEDKDGKLMVHFADTDAQFAAVDPVKATLGSKYTVALNLAPTTPDWLGGAGAQPMYLGLDLRGGVHFLMEVDMDEAVNKAVSRYKDELGGYLRVFKTLPRQKKSLAQLRRLNSEWWMKTTMHLTHRLIDELLLAACCIRSVMVIRYC